MLICGLDMTGPLPHLLFAHRPGLTIWPSAKVWLTYHEARQNHQHSSGRFGVPGLKRREMPTENNEDRPLDVRNSIHKEAILSQVECQDTLWYKPIVPWTPYRVDTSAHD